MAKLICYARAGYPRTNPGEFALNIRTYLSLAFSINFFRHLLISTLRNNTSKIYVPKINIIIKRQPSIEDNRTIWNSSLREDEICSNLLLSNAKMLRLLLITWHVLRRLTSSLVSSYEAMHIVLTSRQERKSPVSRCGIVLHCLLRPFPIFCSF